MIRLKVIKCARPKHNNKPEDKDRDGNNHHDLLDKGYRWVEWDTVAFGVFFPSGWDLMD